MPSNSSTDQLLRKCAWVELDEKTGDAIRRACLVQRNWKKVVDEAELHGLSPYVNRSIKETGAQVPDETQRTLNALSLRHARSGVIRTAALLEIVREARRRDIDVLVLKGAALAHLVYDNPGLRPMRDVDILVGPEHLDKTAEVLANLGYRATDHNALLPDHHHLPNMARELDGLNVSVEIHHDALTPDNIGSIQVTSLSEPPREFTVDGVALHALGHLDTLRHLCRHALEPRETMKLGSALDIMLYACRFAGEIDWQRLKTAFPEVVTLLQLLGYLVPWPAGLSRFVPRPSDQAPEGVGTGMIPLSDLRRRNDRLARLLNPSDWWLRGFYNVPPGRSLAYTKALRHPLRVLFWLWRRRGKGLA
jgi:hypothetical protein